MWSQLYSSIVSCHIQTFLLFYFLSVSFAFSLFDPFVCSSDIYSFCADAGKSTTGGQILFLSGQVDDRTIQKYEKEAKDKSRESWLVYSEVTFVS